MFWKNHDNPLRRFNVRLALIVTLVAALASLIIYGFLLASLARDFRQQDRAELDSRLISYWAAWQYGGQQEVLNRASDEIKGHGGRPFLLVLNDSEGKMIGGLVPGGWEEFDLKTPALGMLHPGSYVTLKSGKRDYALMLTGMELDDMSRLLVGISTENREFLLQMYQSNYPLALVGIILIGITTGLIAAKRLLAPISGLNREIDRIIVTGELSRRLESPGTGDQLDGLIIRFNRLLDRVESLISGMRGTLDAVAHDLRTPLTRLRGYAEIALRNGKSEEYEETLATVVEQTDQAGALLSALMDIAEAEQGMLPLEKRPYDLCRVCEEITEMYGLIAEEKQQSIVLHADNAVPIWADPVRLRQILGNLIDNAVKYGPEGGCIYVRCFQQEALAVLEVDDEGPGVPEADSQRVFDRLYRGDQSRGSRGLGLGLSMVKALVEAHNGEVTVKRSSRGGACFRIEFQKHT